MLSRVALLSLCAALPLAAQDQEETREFAVLPVRDFTANRASPIPAPIFGFLDLVDLDEDGYPGRRDDEWQCALEIDEIVEFLSAIDARYEEGEILVETMENTIHVAGTKDQIRETEAYIRALRAHLLTPVHIEVIQLATDGRFSPTPVLDAKQADAVLGNAKVIARYQSETISQFPVSLGRSSSTPYRYLNELEVAEESRSFLTRRNQFFQGLLAVVEPHRLATSDDLVLRVRMGRGKLNGEVRSVDLPLDGNGDLDQPELAVTALRTSVRIPNGGAAIFRFEAPDDLGGSFALAIRATCAQPKLPLPEGLAILSGSALGFTESQFPHLPSNQMLGTGHDDGGYDIDEIEPPIDLSRLEDIIRNTIDPDIWDDTGYLTVKRNNLVAIADEAKTLAAVKAMLQRFEEQLLTNQELHFHSDSMRISLPVLGNRQHLVRHGVVSLGIDGTEIEIAKESAGRIPRVVDLFRGMEFLANIETIDQTLFARVRWQERNYAASDDPLALPIVERVDHSMSRTLTPEGTARSAGLFGQEHWSARRQ